MSAPRRAFSRIVTLLKWQANDPALLNYLENLRIAKIRLSIVEGGSVPSRLLMEFDRLPEIVKMRVASAPECFRLAHVADQESARASYETLIQIEKHLCGDGVFNGVEGEYWSALGDACLQIDQSRCATVTRVAPLIDGIVIDGYSPFMRQAFPPHLGQISIHPVRDFEQATQNVKSALGYIGQHNAPARCLVAFALKVLALGGVGNFPTATVSNSFYDSAGMAALTNAHLPAWSTESLADSIVHEAVHSLLFHVQLTTPIYHDVEIAREIMVRSPWTGRMLGLSAFVHACFVWFALWSFWKDLSESSLNAQRLGARAQTGFSAKSPLSELSAKSYDCVSAEVRDAIHEMWCEVKNSSREFVQSAESV